MSAARDAQSGDDELDLLVESFLASRRRGEAPTLEGFLARHPARADELRELLQAVLALGELEAAPASPLSPPTAARLERLGPYRIVREIGRGGMGLVYEAVQVELGRRVALKVLPEHRLARESDVLRFSREAMLASRLDHPAICTVYESGREADAPYIAMRFVEGESLAQRIEAARRAPAQVGTGVVRLPEARGDSSIDGAPSARTLGGELGRVVRLIERVARGLHAAHEAGIVHRDIKPGNIMVGRDGFPVILDFGMARLLEPQGDSVTRTGDVCGTPAYMSPEQISARAVPVERESDVYSLGVTLFECLTLRLPFEAPTREALYRAILVRDAPDARSLNPALPRDLAAILGQALEKSPARRYRTAQDFADDLQRLLELRPVRARPVGRLRRALRAARRHPALSSAIALGLVVLVGTPTLIAVRQRLESAHLSSERTRTRANYEEARDAIDQLLREVGEERLSDLPQSEPLRRRMLDEALAFYVRMQAVNSEDPEVRLETARACRRVGYIQDKLGRFAESESAFRQALAQLEQLCALDPDSGTRRLELAEARLDLVNLLLETNRTAEAEPLLVQLLAEAPRGARADGQDGGAARARASARLRLGQVQRQTGRLADAQASQLEALREIDALAAPAALERATRERKAEILAELGDLQAMRGQLVEAGARLERAVEIAAELCAADAGDDALRLRLSRSRQALARFWLATGRHDEAEQAYLAAQAELDELVSRAPGRIAFLRAQAEVQNELASVWMRTERRDDALRGYQRALEMQQRVLATAPEQAFYQEALSRAFANLAFAEGDASPEQAEHDYQSALALSDRLAREHPEQLRFAGDAANDHDCLGSLYFEHGRTDEAEREYVAALALRRALAEAHPEVPDYQSDLGGLLHNYARIVRARGELHANRALLEEAVCLQLAALAANPGSTLYHDYLLFHREGLAETNLRLGELPEAALQAEECLNLLPGNGEEELRTARTLARCAAAALERPGLPEEQRRAARLDYGRRALRVLARALEHAALSRAEFEQDADLAPLREEPAFSGELAALLERAR